MKRFTIILFYLSVGLIPLGFIFRLIDLPSGNMFFVLGLLGLFIYYTAKTIKDIIKKRIILIHISLNILIILMSATLFTKYLYWGFGDYPGLLIIPLYIFTAIFYLTTAKSKDVKLTITSVLFLLLSVPLFGFKFHKSPIPYLPAKWTTNANTNERDIKKDVLINDTKLNIRNIECTKIYEQAISFCDRGDYKNAREFLLRCNDIEPNNATILNSLGICWKVLGNYDKAMQCYYNAIKVDSLQLEAYASAGYALIEKHYFNEAIQILKLGYSKSNENQFTHYNISLNLAVAYFNLDSCLQTKKYLSISKNHISNNPQFDEGIIMFEKDVTKYCH